MGVRSFSRCSGNLCYRLVQKRRDEIGPGFCERIALIGLIRLQGPEPVGDCRVRQLAP